MGLCLGLVLVILVLGWVWVVVFVDGFGVGGFVGFGVCLCDWFGMSVVFWVSFFSCFYMYYEGVGCFVWWFMS